MKYTRSSTYNVVEVASLAFLALLLSSCMNIGPMQGPATAFRLTSPGLPDNGMLAQKNVGITKTNKNCTGTTNLSPPLQWINAPENTRSFAIFMHDHAGRTGLGVSHWVAYGIPANITALAEGEASSPSAHIVPGKGTTSGFYAGPCPPIGNAPQHYVFTLIATDLEPDALKSGLTEAEMLESLKGHTLRVASLVLRYAQ